MDKRGRGMVWKRKRDGVNPRATADNRMVILLCVLVWEWSCIVVGFAFEQLANKLEINLPHLPPANPAGGSTIRPCRVHSRYLASSTGSVLTWSRG
jgi:hypothetical protein